MQLEDVEVGMLVMAITDHPSGNRYLTAGDIGTIVHIYQKNAPPIGIDWGATFMAIVAPAIVSIITAGRYIPTKLCRCAKKTMDNMLIYPSCCEVNKNGISNWRQSYLT